MAKERVVIEILAQTKQSLANLAKFTAGIFAAVRSVQTVVRVGKEMVDAYFKQEDAITKLNAALIATNNLVGISSNEMQKYAKELSNLTGLTDQSVMEAQALMVTFTQVGKDTFPRAIEAAADMSAMFGQDLQQSVIQLGTALNDPIAGVGRLRRIGISFTQAQKDQIKTLMETNDIMGAQKVILDELNAEFGGVAKAVGESTVGAFKKLGNAYVDLQEESGHLIAVGLQPVAEWMTTLLNEAAEANRQMRLVGEALAGIGRKDLAQMEQQLEALIEQWKSLTKAQEAGWRTAGRTRRETDELIKTIEEEIAQLNKDIDAEKKRQATKERVAAAERKEAAEYEAATMAKADSLERLNHLYGKTEQSTIENLRADIEFAKSILNTTKDSEEYARALAIINKLMPELQKHFEKTGETIEETTLKSATSMSLLTDGMNKLGNEITLIRSEYAKTDEGSVEAIRSQIAYYEKLLPFAGEYSNMLEAIISKLEKQLEIPMQPAMSFAGFEEGATKLKSAIDIVKSAYAQTEEGAAKALEAQIAYFQKLLPYAGEYKYMLDKIIENLSKQEEPIDEIAERWAKFGETLSTTVYDGLISLASAFGEALVAGEDMFEALKEAGKNAIAVTLEAFAKQFAVEAIAALARLDPIGAAGFTAASLAAGVAAGAIRGLAEGGIVTRPIITAVGERGPEAVIPLEKTNIMGTTINHYYNIHGSYITEKEMAARVAVYNAKATRGY